MGSMAWMVGVVFACVLATVFFELERAGARGCKGVAMAEPGSTMAGGVAGYKLFLLGIPVAGVLVGFWLGLRFVPLRKGYELADVTNRMVACAASSFVLGLPALIALQRHFPEYVGALVDMALLAGVEPQVAYWFAGGVVFLACSIPGPWLVAAVFLWLERRKKKDIGQIIREVRGGGQ